MNYTELVTAVSNYAENQFTTADMNAFIRQAELRVYNTIQFPILRKTTTGTTTISNSYLSCPSDFLAMNTLSVTDGSGNVSYLLNKDVSFIREAYPNPNTTGLPKYYALYGPTTTNANPPVITTELSFLLGPTPDLAYVVTLGYFYTPESIVTAGTTWLGDNFDPVLLYGTLLEAYTYMKGEAEVIAGYQKRYDEALAMAKRLGDGLQKEDFYRNSLVKVPVT